MLYTIIYIVVGYFILITILDIICNMQKPIKVDDSDHKKLVEKLNLEALELFNRANEPGLSNEEIIGRMDKYYNFLDSHRAFNLQFLVFNFTK